MSETRRLIRETTRRLMTFIHTPTRWWRGHEAWCLLRPLTVHSAMLGAHPRSAPLCWSGAGAGHAGPSCSTLPPPRWSKLFRKGALVSFPSAKDTVAVGCREGSTKGRRMIRNGYVNVFIGKGNYRYPSGIIHKTREAAERAKDKPELVGNPVYVAQVTWEEPDGYSWR